MLKNVFQAQLSDVLPGRSMLSHAYSGTRMCHHADLRLHASTEGRDIWIDVVGSGPLPVAIFQHCIG